MTTEHDVTAYYALARAQVPDAKILAHARATAREAARENPDLAHLPVDLSHLQDMPGWLSAELADCRDSGQALVMYVMYAGALGGDTLDARPVTPIMASMAATWLREHVGQHSEGELVEIAKMAKALRGMTEAERQQLARTVAEGTGLSVVGAA